MTDDKWNIAVLAHAKCNYEQYTYRKTCHNICIYNRHLIHGVY